MANSWKKDDAKRPAELAQAFLNGDACRLARPTRPCWSAGASAPPRNPDREGARAGQRTYRMSRRKNLIQRCLDTVDAERRLSSISP